MTAATPASDVFGDLEAEDERLEVILTGLQEDQWLAPSAAEGWTVRDVVVHLVQTDEAVTLTATGSGGSRLWAARGAGNLDAAMDQAVRTEAGAPARIFTQWRQAWRAALAALRQADPATPLPWAAAPLRPRALATTRLAEHWTHGLDITGSLNIAFPDTDRLRHVAWLAHRSLPYAWSLTGREPRSVFCVLTAPSGATWTFGPEHAESVIRGSAGEFCRVGAQRLSPDAAGLIAEGPYAREALQVLRNYAA